jgi:hypothetical protein
VALVAFGNESGGLISEPDLLFSGWQRVDFLGDLNGRLGALLFRKRAKIAELALDSSAGAGVTVARMAARIRANEMRAEMRVMKPRWKRNLLEFSVL